MNRGSQPKWHTHDKCLRPRWGNKTCFRSELDHFNDGGKRYELCLIRWDKQLTFTPSLTCNGQTFGLDRTFTLSLPVSPYSEAAICPVLGAGTPRVLMLALNVHHNYTGYRFPEGLHTVLIQFHCLQKEHLTSEDYESCQWKYFLEDGQHLKENGPKDQKEGDLKLQRFRGKDFLCSCWRRI